jgi:hypothetical protein
MRTPITIAGEQIYPDEEYYISYVGEQRLSSKERSEYDKIMQYPGVMQLEALFKLNPKSNPNIVPLKGIKVLHYIFERDYVPIFDSHFKNTRKMTLIKKAHYDAMVDAKES